MRFYTCFRGSIDYAAASTRHELLWVSEVCFLWSYPLLERVFELRLGPYRDQTPVQRLLKMGIREIA